MLNSLGGASPRFGALRKVLADAPASLNGTRIGYRFLAITGPPLTASEVARVLGLREPPKHVPYHCDRAGAFSRGSEVESYLRSLRVARLWTVDKRNGSFQMLSETLLVIFRNFFNPTRADSALLHLGLPVQQR